MFRALIFILLFLPSLSQAACRQALVLALDVSGSVNDDEYWLQINGLADALDTPNIRALVLSGGNAHLRLAVFEWSSQNHQRIVLPWTSLQSDLDIDNAITRIRAHKKQRQGLKTAIGRAQQYALGLLQRQQACWQHTIDVSADGKNNAGPLPTAVYTHPDFRDVTVNVLVVNDPNEATAKIKQASKANLDAYFATEVLHGAGAFTQETAGYEDYARAMRKKLEREISVPIIGMIDPNAVLIRR